MQIGDLDRRIILEHNIFQVVGDLAVNNYGEQITYAWSTFATVWAHIDWEGGSSKDESDKVTATTKAIFTIRDIGWSSAQYSKFTGYRVSWDSQYYYIRVVRRVDGRQQFLELETELVQ